MKERNESLFHPYWRTVRKKKRKWKLKKAAAVAAAAAANNDDDDDDDDDFNDDIRKMIFLDDVSQKKDLLSWNTRGS